jgi:FtsZ-binding cell division protein ZapB
VEELEQYNFVLLCPMGTSNAKADILSRRPVFTSREGGTTSATNLAMLEKEQWLEVGAMELDFDNGIETIQLLAMEVEQLLLEAKERIKKKAMLDNRYREVCKQVTSGRNMDENIAIKDELLVLEYPDLCIQRTPTMGIEFRTQFEDNWTLRKRKNA